MLMHNQHFLYIHNAVRNKLNDRWLLPPTLYVVAWLDKQLKSLADMGSGNTVQR